MAAYPEPVRALDHLVLPVASLKVARERLARLGFTVADDARHPFGTENACVYFEDGSYLEPLGIASREECEAAAKAGNVFVARDQAFRFRCGEGFSSLAIKSADAGADHERFGRAGLPAGELLAFERPMKMPDGTSATAAFLLAFAADLRSPDFHFFTCERRLPLPVDRGSLTRHANGVSGIAAVVLSEENPSDFQYFLEESFRQREVNAHSFGIELATPTARVEVLTPEGLKAYYGIDTADRSRGLRGRAGVFAVADAGVTEALLAGNGIAFSRVGARIVVAPSAGQGMAVIFEEQA